VRLAFTPRLQYQYAAGKKVIMNRDTSMSAERSGFIHALHRDDQLDPIANI
jgi:uncharacterized protein YqfB (UPF0267 family)